jgi:hypothetical protein
MCKVWHLGHVSLFIIILHLTVRDMWLQAFVEVQSTCDGVDNGKKDKDEGDDGEGGQRFYDSFEVDVFGRGVHADKLEDEIGKGCKVKDLDRPQSDHFHDSR